MKRHVNEVHDKVRNHMCNTCGKTFARKDKLRAHELVHTEGAGGGGVVKGKDVRRGGPGRDSDGEDKEKPFLCHKCGKGYARQVRKSSQPIFVPLEPHQLLRH